MGREGALGSEDFLPQRLRVGRFVRSFDANTLAKR